MGCGTKKQEWSLRSTLEELKSLAETAQAVPVSQVLQFRDRIDPAWYIGRGKAEEIARMVEENEADLVIFDQELSPAQLRNLEGLMPCKVIDRTQLILDIFAQRARTKEGKIQVELAQLKYLLPRLAGKGKEMSRLGGGIGTRGPGEKKLETDRRHIRRQISVLTKQLEEIKKHRRLHQERRKKNGIPQVALVGYTNAGKSTLLNQLTGAGVLSENRLFATLDPTSRQLVLPSGKEVILTDTVGFIRQLPHHLIAAFRSTLEQVKEADLLLHVVDASHPEAEEQVEAVEQVLADLNAADIPVLMVWNKADRLERELPEGWDPDHLMISAFNEQDLDRLKARVEQALQQEMIIGQVEIPVMRGDWISLLHHKAEMIESNTDDLMMVIKFRLSPADFEQLPGELKSRIQIQ
ncbi:GTPase HflX [Thermoactinomyces vulgaris]|uniref:GTPase HflX n=1 Tax=Thermoactinomyces vulgaris TaxID=2026 RepID=A0ABS0QJ71_THEVU|nr:GTPase HflX [Thermoactinomyces vulgaris]MBA4597285.1 GTPase HflX [Thermoactinomyces vulgaris]MBH8582574.1 GTPase HflX [Thermoactinomyces sp. CICC 10735]MBH8589232.1 GTPase HflX [Thermoactinomyces vulgaris]QBK14614.1 GTPase HflX [Thermoactinomyces vulgaris]